MAPISQTAMLPPPTPATPGHKRTTSSILKSLVTPRTYSPKKYDNQTKSSTTESTPKPFLLPPISLTDLRKDISPLEPLEPPHAPFHNAPSREASRPTTAASAHPSPGKHKKTFSISSFGEGSPTRDKFPSIDIARSGVFSDSHGNGIMKSPERSPGKTPSVAEKKPSKKPTLDFSKLKQKVKDRSPTKEKESPRTPWNGDYNKLGRGGKKPELNKENQAPSSPVRPSRFSGILSSPSKTSNGASPILSPSYFAARDRPMSYVEQQRSPYYLPAPSPRGSVINISPRSSVDYHGSNIPRRNIQDPIALYTPQAYTPSSQRNFHGQGFEVGLKARPKSAYYAPAPNSGFNTGDGVGIGGRRVSGGRGSWEVSRTSTDDRSRPPTSTSSSRSGGNSVKSGITKPEANADIDAAFEALLENQGAPQNIRQKLRMLDQRVKQNFINNESLLEKMVGNAPLPAPPISSQPSTLGPMGGLFSRRPPSSNGPKSNIPVPAKQLEPAFQPEPAATSSKRSRPRTKTLMGRDKEPKEGSNSPSKKRRSADESEKPSLRIKSIIFTPSAQQSSGERSPTRGQAQTITAEEFVDYLKLASAPSHSKDGMKDVELEKLHKLRLYLRNERLRWVEGFIALGGMTALVNVLNRCLNVEWREEHEDLILHELLLCLKALCTANLALEKLLEIENTLFPCLLNMIFDENRKGPAEYSTRVLVFNVLFAHLSAATMDDRAARAHRLLTYLSDKAPRESARPHEFIERIHTRRPYKRWSKEIVNVTKEVFWIFLHGTNIVALPKDEFQRSPPPPSTYPSETELATASKPLPSEPPYAIKHFPTERPPVPAAPHVGSIEYEATTYLAAHLDLLNGIIASLATKEERNNLRMDLRNSGFEKVMGGSLRICKERIHTWLHDGLRTWVAAGVDDEWAVETVRFGPVSTSSSRDYHQPGGGGAIGLVPKSPERSVGQQTPQQLQQSPGKRRSKRPDLDMAFGEKGLEEELQLPKLDLDLGSQSAWAF